MFLVSLFSTLCLFASPIATNPALQIVHEHHLETPAGKAAFLADKLSPKVTAADNLNREIQDLAMKIQGLSPEEEQPQIIALTEEMTEKMGKLLTIMPVLNLAMSIEQDFAKLDEMLEQTAPLSSEQQEVIDRITTICKAVE